MILERSHKGTAFRVEHCIIYDNLQEALDQCDEILSDAYWGYGPSVDKIVPQPGGKYLLRYSIQKSCD